MFDASYFERDYLKPDSQPTVSTPTFVWHTGMVYHQEFGWIHPNNQLILEDAKNRADAVTSQAISNLSRSYFLPSLRPRRTPPEESHDFSHPARYRFWS